MGQRAAGARGVASHFNDATALDATLFTVAGVMIAAVVAVSVVFTVLAFRRIQADPSMARAIRTGLVVLNLSMAVGVLMITQGGAQVDTAATLKIPHAVGMHAIQILPALAWSLSFTTLPAARQLRLVTGACVGYLGLMGVVALQTIAG